MFNSTSKHSYRDLFEGMVIGGGLTGLAIFLFGTKKGKEIQKEFVKKYKKLRHRAEMSIRMLGYKSKLTENIRKAKSKSRRRHKHPRSKSRLARAA